VRRERSADAARKELAAKFRAQARQVTKLIADSTEDSPPKWGTREAKELEIERLKQEIEARRQRQSS